MMTASEYLAALQAEGLHVVQRPGWLTRTTGNTWTPVGTVTHHTGPYSSVASILDLLEQGRSDLSGPLCQASCAPDGTIYLTAWGAANHAGQGDPDVLAAVKADRAIPAPNDTASTSVGGNQWFAGLESIHPGDATPWPAAQVDAMVRYSAAICRLNGWSANRAIGHKEWTTRKIDPYGIDMDQFRGAIAARLSPQTKSEDDDMAVIVRDAAGHAVATNYLTHSPITAAERVTLVNAGKATDLPPNDALYAYAISTPRAV